VAKLTRDWRILVWNDEKNALNSNLPFPGFVHKAMPNGITVSTCQGCMRSIGSPTPNSLRMAEEHHVCEVTRPTRKLRSRRR
jgi:hypothetical protein